MKKFLFTVLISMLSLALAVSFSAQTKKPVKKNVKPAAATPTPQPSPQPAATPETPTVNRQAKKNERPNGGNTNGRTETQTAGAPNYFYEFSQPDFVIEKVVIEHDEAGRGKISFVKNTSSEVITDPIEVSPAALERINNALAALDYFNSTENYQFEKDYSHLGNVTIKISRSGRTRETKFNWTQNTDARTLADEYRKIGNQYIWMFDINLARENQPLESPKLLDVLDSYIRRNEISDPEQMIPFLQKLGDDERIPLIARNHATKLVKQIEKVRNKSKK